jgi:hypothetical protein
MTTEERLERLERELAAAKRRNRRVLCGLTLAGLALVVAVSLGAVTVGNGQVIRAAQFTLIDAEGRGRAALQMTEDGPMLGLFDARGMCRAKLATGEVVPALVLYDEKSVCRAILGVDSDQARLVLHDRNGTQRAILGATPMATTGGRTFTKPESSLLLCGPDGLTIWAAP